MEGHASRKRPLQPPSFDNNTPPDGVSSEEKRNNNAEMEAAPREKAVVDKPGKQNGSGPRRKAAPKVAQTRVTVGMRLKRWIITGRIGAGSFGETFTAVEVNREREGGEEEDMPDDAVAMSHSNIILTDKTEVCIKVEQENKNVLRVEAAALKKLQPCQQVARYLGSGSTGGMSFLVMQRLGPNLAELRRRTPLGTFSAYTVLKIGLSSLQAIRGVHELGLVHRDIKPSNFVIGLEETSDPRTCYLIDFGLARRYRRLNGEVRPPRENAGFRGTSRYASLSSHYQQELGRVDDIWSLLFMLIEFATGTLPWRKYKEKEDIGRCKEEVIGPGLVQNLPREFRPFLAHLQTLRYEDEPSYDFLASLMERAIERRGYPPNKRLDWEPEEGTNFRVDPQNQSGQDMGPNRDAYRRRSLERKPPKRVNGEDPLPSPLPLPVVPVPEAVNLSVNRPTLAARLMPPSPRTEEETGYARIRVSEVNVESALSNQKDMTDAAPSAAAVASQPPSALVCPTPNSKGGQVSSEWRCASAVIGENQQASLKEKHSSDNITEIIDVGVGFSPREGGESSMVNGRLGNRELSPPAEVPNKALAVQHAPESTYLQQKQPNEPGKKRVSFALNDEVMQDESPSPPRGRGELRKTKKRVKCECDIM
ncbi:protein kinase [Trypanosoma grayi]|uniref:protein kinase n=1 Tax=Trypanosoma grayi TaxID=71804 RepID=UPI0004F4794C|nr:protein kinase [Trypanosoma grayi]KEG14155.1 protein kinase [Trypanosoma grayi]